MTPEDLIARGFYIFPATRFKTPMFAGWQAASSNDPEKIKEWKAQYPGLRWWGIDCEKSKLCILDVDTGRKPEAQDSFLDLLLEHGDLPPTFRVRTKSGGYHYYFCGLTAGDTEFVFGIDIKSARGLVIAPGSPGYTVEADLPIAPVPEWLATLAGQPKEKAERNHEILIELDKESSVRLAIQYLATAPPAVYKELGDRRTYHTACDVEDFGISTGKVFELMADYWNDRCEPPWTLEELKVKVDNAHTYRTKPIGCAHPEVVFTVWEESTLPGETRYKLLTRDDVAKFPPLKWLVKGIIPDAGVFQVYGPSTAGKSFLIFDMLTAIAEGREWFGHKTIPVPVLYVCLEGQGGLQMRQFAWEKHNGRNLPENFFMLTQSWSIITKKDIVDLAQVAPQGGMIVVDTQNRAAPTINESASEGMGAVLEGAHILRTMIKGCVGLVAHTGKDITRGSRGHSSQLPFMDASMEVNREGSLRSWRTIKVKDGREGECRNFLLDTVVLGVDEDGEDITSCVINPNTESYHDTRGFDLNPTEAAAWLCAQFLVSESPTGEFSIAAWKAALATQLNVKNDKKLANRARNAFKCLFEHHLVEKTNGLYRISALTVAKSED